jgi:hypothetical protein
MFSGGICAGRFSGSYSGAVCAWCSVQSPTIGGRVPKVAGEEGAVVAGRARDCLVSRLPWLIRFRPCNLAPALTTRVVRCPQISLSDLLFSIFVNNIQCKSMAIAPYLKSAWKMTLFAARLWIRTPAKVAA